MKALQAIGSVGAALALTILGASILLRLATVLGADGTQISLLPTAVEDTTRMVHRLSASAVGLLALAASVLCWRRRKELPRIVYPTVLLVGVTVLLALIGPLTPGYRYSIVTVANVAAGTVLLMACWWLREVLAAVPASQTLRHPLLRPALAAFLVHVCLGATASALEMRGVHWPALVHTGSAVLTTLLVSSVLWDRREHAHLAGIVGAMTAVLTLQTVLGIVLLWVDARPIWLGFSHAMLSPLLAGGLVSLAVRDTDR